MQRQLEPELMEDQQQVLAYAEADFSSGDAQMLNLVDQLVQSSGSLPVGSTVLDLGCGPGNITLRLAEHFPQARVIGLDGSKAMLSVARQRSTQRGLPVAFQCCDLRQVPDLQVDLLVSNSLLHHLHDPSLLWHITRLLAAPGCRVLHRDLRRPMSFDAVLALQQKHLSLAPPVLIKDFVASLQAAFTVQEVLHQLSQARLDRLMVEEEDDRYLVVSGLVN